MNLTLAHAPQPIKKSYSGVTEIVLPGFNAELDTVVLPMLAHLTQHSSQRWVTWITPMGLSKTGICKKLLQEYGFNLDKLRLIHLKDNQSSLKVFWDALSVGNSDTVVGSVDQLSDRDFKHLESAAHI